MPATATYVAGENDAQLRRVLVNGVNQTTLYCVSYCVKRALDGSEIADKYQFIRVQGDMGAIDTDYCEGASVIGIGAAGARPSTLLMIPSKKVELSRFRDQVKSLTDALAEEKRLRKSETDRMEERYQDEVRSLTTALNEEKRLRKSDVQKLEADSTAQLAAERQKAEGNLQNWKDHNAKLKNEVEQRCLDTGRLQGTINNLTRECRYLTNKQEVIEMTLKAQGAEIVKRDVILDEESTLAPSLEVVSDHLLSWHAMQQAEEHEWRVAMTQHLTELETMTRGYCFQDEWEERTDLLEAFYCETRLLDSEFKDLEEKVTLLVETANSKQQLQTVRQEFTAQLSAQQAQLQQQAAEIQQLKAMLLARTTPRIPEGFKLGMPKAVNQTHEAQSTASDDDGTVMSTTLLPHEEIFDEDDEDDGIYSAAGLDPKTGLHEESSEGEGVILTARSTDLSDCALNMGLPPLAPVEVHAPPAAVIPSSIDEAPPQQQSQHQQQQQQQRKRGGKKRRNR